MTRGEAAGGEGALDCSAPAGTRTAADVGTMYRVIDKAVLFLPLDSPRPPDSYEW
jgi:hypothetical protein